MTGMLLRKRGQARRSRRHAAQRKWELLEDLETRVLLSAVGGGFAAAGIHGDYFNNISLSGSPTFSRSDVRIDFNWGSTTKPGGSTAPGFADIGTDNYSVRWTGQVIPKFSETYTLKTLSDDGVRLYIKPTSSQTWTTVINDWTDHGVTTDTGTFAMTAGNTYDIKLEYYEHTGGAEISLKWSSPSTPEEVINPVVDSGINNPDWSAGYTDIVKGARNSWVGVDGNPAPGMDAQGYPTGDGGYVFQESLNQGLGIDPLMRGTVTYSFTGKADISIWGNVNGSSLTYSYNSTTNTSTGTFVVADHGINASYVYFRNSTRNGQSGGPGGITNFHLMRPTAPDATTSYATDTTFTPQLEAAMSQFTVIRHQYVANQQEVWSDRTPPNYFNQSGGTTTDSRVGVGSTSNNGASWEYKIMLSNETGRDMMISLPPLADSTYITNLANLLRYGSDASGTPYTTATANPVHPGLNPNLHVYLELGNELWNWGGVFWTDWQNINVLTAQHADADDADFQIINYDNQPTTKDGSGNYTSMNTWRFREIVLKMIQTSDIFRSVYGDAAMPNSGNPDAVIRPLYEWQYANTNNTAELGLTWADKYFNNGDGTAHVSTPHPLNYYLWGGGGAAYYGAVNGEGLTDLPADNSFDNVSVSNGYHQDPGGTQFTFGGTAGVARDAGSGDNIPTPLNGSQVGYITDTGSIQFSFTTPADQTSDLYAFSFKAVNRTESGGALDHENVRVYLDYGTGNQVDITARSYSQGNGYTPVSASEAGSDWDARVVAWTLSAYYYTQSVALTAGSTHTITILGQGDINNPSNTNQTAFFDDVRVTSVDAIFAGGIPGGGEATGQPVGENIRNTMDVEADWAKAFGLQELSYESGWSLGGDDGGSWIQLDAKYGDARTATAQQTFMDYFYEAGSAVNVFGTYAQWPNWSDYYAEQGLLDASNYPIVQGVEDAANTLPVDVSHGVSTPAVLQIGTASIFDGSNSTTGQISTAGGFINWTIIAPYSGTYVLSLSTSGTGGTAVILADNAQVASGATGGSAITGTVYLTKGNHSLRIRANSGTAFTVTQLAVSGQNAPAAPTLNTANGGDGSVSMAWGSVSGATGYVVRYGTSAGEYSARVDVGSALSYNVSGLTNNETYYFAVDAYNANGESLPSNEKNVIPLAPGQTGTLAVWELAGTAYNASTAPVDAAASGFAITDLTLGPGLKVNGQGFYNGFLSQAVGNNWGSDLATSIADNQYETFTLTVDSGRSVALESLLLQSWFQNTPSGRGIGLTYSTDGTNFTTAGSVTGSAADSHTFDLSGISALQNLSGEVVFRVYFFGGGGYTTVGLGNRSGDDVLLTGSVLSGLPTGWSDADIGSVGSAGSAGFDGTTWTVKGSGTDIWGTSDQFNFASESWTGNGQIVARVASVGNTDSWAKAGVMFRDSTAANAMYAAVEVTPGSGVSFQWRSSTGGSAASSTVTGVTAPEWVKLVRSGNSFTAYYSSDGSNWTQVGSTETVAMASTARAGLEVTAHNNAALCTATFDNVSVGAVSSYGTIAGWELAGTAYNASSAPVDTAASGFTVSDITLGGGLKVNTQTPFTDGFMAQAADNVYSTNLAGAISSGDYETFSITAQSGHNMSLSSILLRTYFQNTPSTRGVGLGYSTDGTNFTTVGSYTGSGADAPTFDLSGISALQGFSGTATFRIYIWGDTNYTTVGLGRQSGNDVVVSGYYA